jgi:hypothetical protein
VGELKYRKADALSPVLETKLVYVRTIKNVSFSKRSSLADRALRFREQSFCFRTAQRMFRRICMMINWLLKNLGQQAEIDEILYQKIHDNMMERMQDKVAEIRAQAVTALQRLQVGQVTPEPAVGFSLSFAPG